MELKLFSDLVEIVGRAVGGLKTIVNLPKAERETIRRTLDETYRLIDTTHNMNRKVILDQVAKQLTSQIKECAS